MARARGGRKVTRYCPEPGCPYSTGYASPAKVAVMLGQHVAAKHPRSERD